MDLTQHYRSIFRVRRVILSCRTEEQLKVARAMFHQLLKNSPVDSWKIQWEFIMLIENQDRNITGIAA